MDERRGMDRGALLALGGLIGAVGVASAAAASHGESRNLASIAMIGLAHGPVLVALALVGQGRLLGVAGWLIAAGTVLFAGDLGVREWLGHGLFPGAAPIGGMGMILGWLALIPASFKLVMR